MLDAAKTRKQRDRAPLAGARYGDANGDGAKDTAKAGSRKGARFSFSNEGLALIGLRRGERRRMPPRGPQP